MSAYTTIEKAKKAPISRTQLVPADLRNAIAKIKKLQIQLCDTFASEHLDAAMESIRVEIHAMTMQPDSDFNTRPR